MDTIHDFLHSLINHLIPHEGNDYRPHLLQRGAMLLMLILILLSFLAANFQALLWQSSDWLVGAVLPAVVVDLTNTERMGLSLSTLVRSPVLDAAATLKAQDMAKNSYFSHDSPTGVTPWFWFKEAGYPFVHAGENLAVYFTDSSDVVEAWMNSPTHRANIVGSQYREIGVGTAKGTYNGFDTVFVVQLFGTPAIPAKPLVAIVPTVIAPVAETPLPIATPRPNAIVVQASDTTVQKPLVAGEMSDIPESAGPSVTNSTKTELSPAAEEMSPYSKPESVSIDRAVVTQSNGQTSPSDFKAEAQTVIGAAEAVSLYSGMAASSTNLTPVPYNATVDLANVPAPKLAALATEPSTLLQLIYLVLGGVTAFVLLLSVLLEWRHHRPVQTAYGLLLLIIMAGLFYVHTTIMAGAVIF